MKPIRKKLIEVSIPLEAINKASAREKSIRHGHPSTLHLWWARRPLAACRAVLFAQLVDDPSSWPDRFPTEEAQDIERRRLHRIIEDMVPWEASNNETILNAARWEIARSVAWGLGEEPPAKGDGKAILDYLQNKAPPVYDPFSGGGSIPLEAQRLGLRAYGSDLNPVAVLIGKALVEIPPKFAGKAPVNPKSRAEIALGGKWNGKGVQGLAEDVRYYGQWMRDEAEKRIGHLYPKAKLPDGSEATVIAWLWARTVRSPDPAAKGAMVPLMSTFMISTKDGKQAWVEPIFEASAPDGYRFEVRSGALDKEEEANLKKGTKAAKAEAFVCLITSSPIERSYIQGEGKAGRIQRRLLALVVQGKRRKIFVTPTIEHEALATEADQLPLVVDARHTFLSGKTPDRSMITGGVCTAYGLSTWGHLFTGRQINALSIFSDLVSEARANARTDALNNGLIDGARLVDQGADASAYADAIATYLVCAVGRAADFWTSQATWLDGLEAVCHAFTRQGLPMVWNYVESNPFSTATGNWSDTVLGWIPKVIQSCPASGPGSITILDAAKMESSEKLIFSFDPPYYDNISYAVLADFFYNWHRRSGASIWPNLTRRLSTPKDEELVVMRNRHKDRNEAEAFFIEGMSGVIAKVAENALDRAPITIYYAFKQTEAKEGGVTSAGWASFLQAVFDSGFSVDGTWPVRTERAARSVGIGANALASSIVLVCRKRTADAATITRANFIRALKRELPDAIDDIRKAGVGPVDMQQSVIGPGMGVFSRHGKVLEDDDSAMPVKTALSLINRVWEEIDQELDAAFDAETQVALAWFATFGFEPRASGELITLANAKNIASNALFDSGVFKDLKGKAALTPRNDLPKGWTPAADKTLTVWECVQHTARVLNAEDGGGAAAGRLVAEMGPKAADARALAYRLFEIATQKGWAAEALIYNELAQEWPKLEDLASTADIQASTAAAQAELDI